MTTTFSTMNTNITDTSAPRYQVLVVDDEPLLCRMVSVMLKRVGYEIRTAYNGTEALQAVAEQLPDLITLDVMMPDISGLDVARRLRADERTSAIPIVFVTALDRSVSDELRALSEQPGIYHLDKPFSQHQLVTQVADALRAHV
ncbi:MAG: response regulator [Caldilineaceae bacterium]|nr:response regulator [Caldilineaceae bacterium]